MTCDPNKLLVDRTASGYYLRWECWGADSRLTQAARKAVSRTRLWHDRSPEGYYVFRTPALAEEALVVAREAVSRCLARIDLA